MPMTHLPDDTEHTTVDTLDPKFYNDGEEPRRSTGDAKLDALLARLAALEDPMNPGRDRALIRMARREVEQREEELAVAAAAHRRAMAEKRAKTEAARKVRADKVEATLRESPPYVEFHDGARIVRVDLSGAQVSREAIRVLAWGLSEAFSQRVRASRQLAAIQALSDWVAPLIGSELHYAAQRGLIRFLKEN